MVHHLTTIPGRSFQLARLLVHLSDALLDFLAAVDQELVGSLEQLRLAALLRDTDEFEQLLQLYDSEFCQVPLEKEANNQL